jgi:hypothetical protein
MATAPNVQNMPIEQIDPSPDNPAWPSRATWATSPS